MKPLDISLLHGSRTSVLAELVVLDEQAAEPCETHEGDADTEGGAQSQHVGMQDLGLQLWTEGGSEVRVPHDQGDLGVDLDQGLEVGLDSIVEDSSSNGNSKNGSDCTEEGGIGGGDSNILGGNRGLDCNHDGLHGETQSETVDEQEANLHTLGRVLVQESQETSTGGGQDETDPDEWTVLAPLGDHETGGDGSDQETDNQGQHLKTRSGSGFLTNNLEEQWHEEHDTEEAHTDEERGGEDSDGGLIPEETEGDDGLERLLPLDQAEDAKDNESSAEESNDERIAPCVGASTPVQWQEDQDKTNNQGEGSKEVNATDLILE